MFNRKVAGRGFEEKPKVWIKCVQILTDEEILKMFDDGKSPEYIRDNGFIFTSVTR